MVRRGVHLGHPISRWNPKMAPYIYTKRKGVCIIDLIQTAQQLKHVSNKLTLYSSQGKSFLFVGTKQQASEIVSQVAIESESFYVNQRWLGGILTNWKTIKNSLYTLQKLQAQESSGAFLNLPKKEATTYRKNKERLQKYLGGLQGMRTLPDVVVIFGQIEEMNAVLECQKLGIITVSILDTDCDPTLTNLFVVANDDSLKSLEFLCQAFLEAILLGREESKGVEATFGRYPSSARAIAPQLKQTAPSASLTSGSAQSSTSQPQRGLVSKDPARSSALGYQGQKLVGHTKSQKLIQSGSVGHVSKTHTCLKNEKIEISTPRDGGGVVADSANSPILRRPPVPWVKRKEISPET